MMIHSVLLLKAEKRLMSTVYQYEVRQLVSGHSARVVITPYFCNGLVLRVPTVDSVPL